MTWKARLIEPEELQATIDLTAVAFGAGPRAPDDYRKQASLLMEPDRVFVVEDGDVLAGTGGAFSMALTLPGRGTLPLAGVSWVGVPPTHRRRGVLRTLMDAVHEQALARGEPIAGLTASEGGIYRRFGYGVATRFHSLSIDRAKVAEVVPPLAGSAAAAEAAGRIRLVSEDEAKVILPAVWERYWPRVPGEVSRPTRLWDELALDVEHDRDGASARYIAVHDDAAGAPDGFAIYRIKQDWDSANALPHTLRVESVAAADDAVETALLRFLMSVDLIATIEWAAAPTDLPLRWHLANPRAVRVTSEADHLWLRPFDVAACLAARRYAIEDALVLEVIDPPSAGRFRVEGGPDGAACHRSDAEAELVVGLADLGALLLGGVSWATLRRAALVDERTPGAVARADAMFRSDRAPYCSTGF